MIAVHDVLANGYAAPATAAWASARGRRRLESTAEPRGFCSSRRRGRRESLHGLHTEARASLRARSHRTRVRLRAGLFVPRSAAAVRRRVDRATWCMATASTMRTSLLLLNSSLLLLDTSLLPVRTYLPPCSSCCPWPWRPHAPSTSRRSTCCNISARPWRRRRRSWRRWHQCRSSRSPASVASGGTPPWCSTQPY